MYGYAGGGSGGGDANYAAQQGYQTRSRGRGRSEAQEERYVEGDLFGSTKHASFRSSDPPPGQPPRAAYYDTGCNTFRNGAAGGSGGGYNQSATAQPSPFAGQPAEQNGFIAAAGIGGGGGRGGATSGGAGTAYGGRGYGGQSMNGAGGGRTDYNANAAWSSSEAALVPVDSNGSSRVGQSSMLDHDDDDFMPTRSLADNDVGDGAGAELRQRRGGGGRAGSGTDQGFSRQAEPDVQRATWVVVWGVPQGKETDVLTRFLQFGHVEEQRGLPDSNWLYFKYATRLQAEKALAAGHTARLTETVMLGVSRVEDEAWQSLREGRVPSIAAAQPVLSRGTASRPVVGDGATSTPSTGRVAMEVDDADLLGAPPQRPRGERSMCGRIMAFFGFY